MPRPTQSLLKPAVALLYVIAPSKQNYVSLSTNGCQGINFYVTCTLNLTDVRIVKGLSIEIALIEHKLHSSYRWCNEETSKKNWCPQVESCRQGSIRPKRGALYSAWSHLVGSTLYGGWMFFSPALYSPRGHCQSDNSNPAWRITAKMDPHW